MAYLLALILPLSFFYSPRIEKANIVMVTKPLTISHERNTPAYTLFQQTQLIQKDSQHLRELQLRQLAGATPAIDLTTDSVAEITTAATTVAELKIEKTALAADADQKLTTLFRQQPDSTSNLQPNFTQTTDGAVIRGQFELKDGVGIVDHTVVLRRVFEGQTVEVGQVDLRAGQYQISVGSFEGEIVAEIKDRKGLLIGEDRQKIINLKRSGIYFEGPKMKLGRPSAFAFNMRGADNRKVNETNITASFFSGFYDLKKTDDVYPNVSRHSSTLGIVKDLSQKNTTTLSVRASADKSETVLFSKLWVEGAIAYLSEQLQIQYLTETGTVLGRVLIDGKPAQGVQMVIENHPGVEPYYLSEFMIPQHQQSSTSNNGYFIIPGLTPGVYEISGYIGDRYIGTQQYIVEKELVTYQELYSLSIPQSVVARSFDAFTGEDVTTDLYVPGQKDIISLDGGIMRYRQFAQYGLTEIVNRPAVRDYAAYVYLQSHTKDHLHLPQIKDAFVEYIKEQLQINLDAETSMLIGFTPQNNFDVHVADENFNKNNIVFFDHVGKIVPKQTLGGGFIIFNLPKGFQEVILQDQTTDRSYSTVFYSRPSYLFVTHFSE